MSGGKKICKASLYFINNIPIFIYVKYKKKYVYKILIIYSSNLVDV
jgi:hypothetical protein